MADNKTESTELKEPRKPLVPVQNGDSTIDPELDEAYKLLSSQYEDLSKIYSSLNSWDKKGEDDPKAVAEYKRSLAEYTMRRDAYNDKYNGMIETIEDVHRNIKRISEELDAFEKATPDEPDPELPDLEDVKDEDWESFSKRMDIYWKEMDEAWDVIHRNMEKSQEGIRMSMAIFAEMSKFEQLDKELEFRLRHTYIDPKTVEEEFRPDDNVGEGMICVGSRDVNPPNPYKGK